LRRSWGKAKGVYDVSDSLTAIGKMPKKGQAEGN